MSELKVLSYNTLATFGDRDRSKALVEFIEDESPDVAFFAEAYRNDGNMSAVQDTVSTLHELGYNVTRDLTDTQNHRTDITGFVGLVRPELGSGSVMQAGIRQGFLAHIILDQKSRVELKIGGVHLDDRSEIERLKQINALPRLDVLMGDLNAMHKSKAIAHILRLFGPITERFPEIDPDFTAETSKADRIKSLSQRLVRMADGRSLQKLESTHELFDIDPSAQPTIHGVAQIDHILVNPRIEASDYKVHTDIKLSDHSPISATIRVA